MEYAIIKDFKTGLRTQEQVYEELKHGGMKLMCGDAQYSWFPGGKIEIIYFGGDGEIHQKLIDFKWPGYYNMFHESEKFGKCLPWGPWYYGYIKEIED